MPPNISYPEDWRLGQVPQWLEVSDGSWVDGDVELSLIHHAELFEEYNDTIFNRYGDFPAVWEIRTHTVYSYGIESQFGRFQDMSDYL